jgi:hypothetical protein
MIATVTGWFRNSPQPGGFARVGRHGNGAAHDLAARELAHHASRLARSHVRYRFARVGAPDSRPRFFVRRPPVNAPESAAAAPDAGSQQLTVGRALTSPQFLILGFTFFLCCAAHSGPIFHVVSYAMWCGLGSLAAVSVYSVEGLAGLGGRLLLGLLADRYGAKRVLVCALLVQAISIATYLKVNELREFYALAVIFGVAYGGGMPLYASLARDYFGQASWARYSARRPCCRASACP